MGTGMGRRDQDEDEGEDGLSTQSRNSRFHSGKGKGWWILRVAVPDGLRFLIQFS